MLDRPSRSLFGDDSALNLQSHLAKTLWGPAPMVSLLEKRLYTVRPAVGIAKIDVKD